MIHPARQIPFDRLIDGLRVHAEAKHVNRQVCAETGLSLWTYSKSCVYERVWNQFTTIARGLILDEVQGAVIATPFPKFFNVGEHLGGVPAEPFAAYEKLDGSLIILFHYAGRWRCATKGSFQSDQAKWAQAWVDANLPLDRLEIGTTYLFEAIYPENKIVVHYAYEGLVLLGFYRQGGGEGDAGEIATLAAALGCRVARKVPFSDMGRMIAEAAILPANEEGWVIRFDSGLRLKVKGAEYLRLHRALSNLTPIAVWEAMYAEADLGAMRRELPEEFWPDFDTICRLLTAQIDALVARTAEYATPWVGKTDKEVGLALGEFPSDVRGLIFPFRKEGGIKSGSRAWRALMRHIRPTRNELDGYRPSGAVQAVQNDL